MFLSFTRNSSQLHRLVSRYDVRDHWEWPVTDWYLTPSDHWIIQLFNMVQCLFCPQDATYPTKQQNEDLLSLPLTSFVWDGWPQVTVAWRAHSRLSVSRWKQQNKSPSVARSHSTAYYTLSADNPKLCHLSCDGNYARHYWARNNMKTVWVGELWTLAVSKVMIWRWYAWRVVNSANKQH